MTPLQTTTIGYYADGTQVKKRGADGTVTTVAGTGKRDPLGQGLFSGDGGPAVLATLGPPAGLALDAAGNLYIADPWNHRIRKVDPDGIITTVAGSGETGFRSVVRQDETEIHSLGGFSGDGGPAGQARLDLPSGVAVDQAGNLYIIDTANQRIRKVGADGVITTVAGVGPLRFDEVLLRSEGGFSGDGGPSIQARLNLSPSGYTHDTPVHTGIVVDSAGNVYFSDTWNRRVRKIDPDGTITTVAGNGAILTRIETAFPFGDYYGDGGTAPEAALGGPSGLAIDSEGNLYIADTENHRIRRVSGVAAPGLIAGTPLLPLGPAAPPELGKGDVNGDGEVTIRDAILVLQSLVHLIALAPYQTAATDWNGDGVTDVIDVVHLLRKIVGLG